MKLAVKFWKDAENNPMAYPGLWPYECIQEGDPLFQESLDSGVYQLMSLADYHTYRTSHQDEYDNWVALQPQSSLNE